MPDPQGDTPQDVIVGRVASAHGVSGGIRVKALSDVPHRFDPGRALHIGGRSHSITHSSPAPNGQVILRLQGIDSVDAAKGLVGQPVTVPQSAVPPPRDGEYYHFQLLGLKVLTDDGECLGRVREILETGSNDVYVVSGESGEVLIPALTDVILQVRLDEGCMVVNLMEGLR